MKLEQHDSPGWMTAVLRAAGLYNLIWGTSVILFPLALFQLGGVEPLPVYPQIWQCLGMVIGVYGIGYLIAARYPFVHWPIVLVGLLGKLMGPIGFVWFAVRGELPWATGVLIIFNDLIWWWPFSAILWQALAHHQLEWSQSDAPEEVGDPVTDLVSQYGRSLAELSAGQPVILVFLRHSGCTFCREALDDLRQQRAAIEAAGVRLAVVHMDTEENARVLVGLYGLQDVDVFRDPGQYLYRHFELGVGTPWQLLGPRVWWRGFKAAILQRHGVGKLGGNGFRMPGTFVIQDGRVLAQYRHRDASDRPDYEGLACQVRGQHRQVPVGADR